MNSLTLDNPGATVALSSTLTLGSTLDLTEGRLNLNAGGRIVGGTIVGAGMVFDGGTLSGVTRQGTLDLSATGAEATITNGITLTGPGGSGPGSILLTGYNSELTFRGTQTLDNATIGIGGNYGDVGLRHIGSLGGSDTLTLGPGVTVSHAGRYASLQIAGDAIINSGTIDAGLANGRFWINSNAAYGPASFTNQGSILISNDDSFSIGGGISFSNQGAIALSSGGELHLWSSQTTAELGSITNSGGTIFLQGLLDNTGAVLATGTLGSIVLAGGFATVVGGTITGSSLQFQGGTLSKADRSTPLSVTIGPGAVAPTSHSIHLGKSRSYPCVRPLHGHRVRLGR